MHARFVAALVALACAVSACGSKDANPSPSSPSPPVPAGPARVSVQILSGGTRQPVPGAHVVIGAEEYSTDQNGLVSPLPMTVLGADVDVQAVGYLPRATRLSAFSSQSVTLWPIANDAEADAVHDMVFVRRNGPDLFYPHDPKSDFYVTIRSAPAEVMSAWKTGSDDFGSVFGIKYFVGTQFQYDPNEIEVVFGPDHGCTPSPVSGFCRTPSPYTIVAVGTDRATDPSTIRRGLATLFLGPNPFHGLLNPDAPTDTLSPFEMQTIRMILQRPLVTFWPDNDR